MDVNTARAIFQRSLMEKLAFAPAGAQAPGPGGANVPQPGPDAGGAPPPPGGAPPADPAAAGGPPPGAMDMPPAAPMDMPPAPEGGSSGGAVTPDQAETVMQIVERTLEAVGKKKTKADGTPTDPNAAAAGGAPDPTQAPGPVTGLPGFDPASISGPLPPPPKA